MGIVFARRCSAAEAVEQQRDVTALAEYGKEYVICQYRCRLSCE